VYHSQDDVIFDVHNSDRLVAQLQYINNEDKNNHRHQQQQQQKQLIRYSRFTKDPENLPPSIRGHSMGITASKSSELYNWLLEVTMI
jgi:predicted peptidase